MVTSDPNRTPNFILSADPDYFLLTMRSPPCTAIPSCFTQTRDHAWNHGGFRRETTHTWLGLAGPGVRERGRTGPYQAAERDRPEEITILENAAFHRQDINAEEVEHLIEQAEDLSPELEPKAIPTKRSGNPMAGLNKGNCPADCLMHEPIRAPGVVWAVMVDKALNPPTAKASLA